MKAVTGTHGRVALVDLTERRISIIRIPEEVDFSDALGVLKDAFQGSRLSPG